MNRLSSKEGGNARYVVDKKVFLKEAALSKPKEYFVRLVSLLRKERGAKPFSLIDVGCATGAFLNYAAQRLPVHEIVGVDVSTPLLRRASVLVPKAKFYKDSVLSLSTQIGRQYDVCTCLGVAAVFFDLKRMLRRLLSLVRPGGSLWIFDIVNRDPIDTLVKFRRATEGDEHPWQKGLNSRSLYTWRRLVREINPSMRLTTWDFELSRDLPKTNDPLRSWTAYWRNGRRQILVGTGQMLNFKFLRIHKTRGR